MSSVRISITSVPHAYTIFIPLVYSSSSLTASWEGVYRHVERAKFQESERTRGENIELALWLRRLSDTHGCRQLSKHTRVLCVRPCAPQRSLMPYKFASYFFFFFFFFVPTLTLPLLPPSLVSRDPLNFQSPVGGFAKLMSFIKGIPMLIQAHNPDTWVIYNSVFQPMGFDPRTEYFYIRVCRQTDLCFYYYWCKAPCV